MRVRGCRIAEIAEHHPTTGLVGFGARIIAHQCTHEALSGYAYCMRTFVRFCLLVARADCANDCLGVSVSLIDFWMRYRAGDNEPDQAVLFRCGRDR